MEVVFIRQVAPDHASRPIVLERLALADVMARRHNAFDRRLLQQVRGDDFEVAQRLVAVPEAKLAMQRAARLREYAREVGVDVEDGSGRMRIVYPRASLDTTGDMTLTKGAMVPLEVTLSALDFNGTLAHIYVARAAGTAPANGTELSATASGARARKSTAPAEAGQ